MLSLLSEAEGAPFRLPRPVALSLPGPKAPKAALALAWVPVDAVPCVAMVSACVAVLSAGAAVESA